MAKLESIPIYLKDLYELNKSLEEWDDTFLDKNDIQIMRALMKIPNSNWNNKMKNNAFDILLKYNDFLKELKIDISSLKKPDYDTIKITESCSNVFEIDNEFKTIKVKNSCAFIKQHFFNDSNSEETVLELSRENVYKIILLFVKDQIKMSKKDISNLNNFLIEQDYDNQQPLNLLSDNFSLKNFQEIGVAYLLLNKKTILGDDMGLGKSIQAIAAIDIAEAYPAVIVCPSSLKFNWKKEISKFVDKKVLVINGKHKINVNEQYDYIILNYEAVKKHKEYLLSISPKSIVFDESHYLKNKEAKRTSSCIDIVNNIKYRFALTGTSILKAPYDLIYQLKAINGLDIFNNENDFLNKYCNPKQTMFGTDYTGSSNIEDLCLKLRENCFIRRDKKTVLKELPEKNRQQLIIDISESKTYKDYANYFRTLPKKEKLASLDKLRQTVANEKIEQLKEWIDDFLLTNEKIVIFAYHIDIQNKLLKMYPQACRLLSEDDNLIREHNKEKFLNDPEEKIIICSLKIASLGFNLTSASNMLFVEMDWCSAINDQAEDRCHRIGQKNSINIMYAVAKDTIEEHIWNVCERKRELINGIYKNIVSNSDELNIYMSIYEEVLEDLDKE